MRADCYISADIEADGPVPGTDANSMLALGLCVAARFDGHTFAVEDPDAQTYYAELRPISPFFEPEALAVSGLDRDHLLAEGRDPAEVMPDVAAWVRKVAAGDRPVMVGWPAPFDFSWLHWYFIRFAGTDPFSYQGGLDIKGLFALKARLPIAEAHKDRIPAHLRSRRPHTHNALDDAKEQADLFTAIYQWDGQITPASGPET